jgi:hypothetical protein
MHSHIMVVGTPLKNVARFFFCLCVLLHVCKNECMCTFLCMRVLLGIHACMCVYIRKCDYRPCVPLYVNVHTRITSPDISYDSDQGQASRSKCCWPHCKSLSLSMCACMHISLHMCMYVTKSFVTSAGCVCMCARVHACTYATNVRTSQYDVCNYHCMHVYTCVCMYVCVCMCVYVSDIYMYIYIYIYIYIYM